MQKLTAHSETGDSTVVTDPGLASSFLVIGNINVNASFMQECFLGLTLISFPAFKTFFPMQSYLVLGQWSDFRVRMRMKMQ